VISDVNKVAKSVSNFGEVSNSSFVGFDTKPMFGQIFGRRLKYWFD